MLKNVFACFAFLLWVCTVHSQPVKILERDWAAFNQQIDISNYRGMDFILEADVRVERTADSLGWAGIWARVDTEKGRGFFDNMANRPVTRPNWTSCVIRGRIDSNAVKFYIGGLCIYNGSFYFDNFRLKIETRAGWVNVNIGDGDFENPANTAWQDFNRQQNIKLKWFSTTRQKTASPHKTVYKITGAGIPIYGANKRAGNFFSTNGVKLYYEVYGKGEPLLLLHGNGQSIEAFRKQIPFFEKQYRVIIPDCRGRGQSTDSDAELTYDIQASDMNNLLDHLHIDSANIIGWSDGGIIGIIMAKDYPKKVKRLIASGANVLQDTTAFLPGDSLKFRNIANDTTRSKITRKLFKLMIDYPNIPFSALAKISCPVLVVAGDNDEIRIGHTVKIFESIPRGQLFILPNATHYLLSENPEIFNAAALRFLKSD